LLFEGFTCNENEPCEWVVERVSTAPVVVVDQSPGSSNPKTSVAAVNADRVTVNAWSSLCEPPHPTAALKTRPAPTERDVIDRRMPRPPNDRLFLRTDSSEKQYGAEALFG
jgi:hypothetical protein